MNASFFSSPAKILALIFLLAVLVRAVPFQFDGFSDPDAHFHARMSEMIVQTHSLIEWDTLSQQGRVYSYPPLLHILVAALSILSGLSPEWVLKLLGVLVGGIFTYTVFTLAHALSRSTAVGVWSALFAAMITVYAWRTAGFLRPDSMAVMLIPFLLYLWYTQREVPALVGSIAMVLLHPLSAVIYAFTLITWTGMSVLRRTRFPVLILAALVGMLITFFLWVFSVGLPFSNYVSHVALDAAELTPFWVMSFVLFFPFSWALSLIGLWKGKPHELVIAWFLLTFTAAAFGMRLVNYMAPFLAILAGYGVVWIVRHIHLLKRGLPILGFMLLLLGGAVIFQITSGITPYVMTGEKASLAWLAANTNNDSVIMNLWDQGHVVTYYTKRPVVIDGYFEFAPNLNARNDRMREVFFSSNCNTISNALSAFGATHIYASRDELVGTSFKLGLLEVPPCEGLSIVQSSEFGRVYTFSN